MTRRRNNAPINPPRPATSIPDLLFCLAAAGWTMAIVFFVSSFIDDNVTAGDAGKTLARLFAGSLFITGLFVFLLGFSLLRDERGQADHFVFPMLLGAVIGAIESLFFLWPIEGFLWAPFLLVVFAFRPLRRAFRRRSPSRSLAG